MTVIVRHRFVPLIVVLSFCLVHCKQETKVLAEDIDAKTLCDRYLKKSQAAIGVVPLPLGIVAFKGTNAGIGGPDVTFGEVFHENYSAYRNLAKIGAVIIENEETCRWGIRGCELGIEKVMRVAVTEKGKPYLCSKEQTAQIMARRKPNFNLGPRDPNRRFLCIAAAGESIEKVVDDQRIKKGGEEYRWIRSVAKRDDNDPVVRAFWSAPSQFKYSMVYKLDPFSKAWTPVQELTEAFPINTEISNFKAAEFFH